MRKRRHLANDVHPTLAGQPVMIAMVLSLASLGFLPPPSDTLLAAQPNEPQVAIPVLESLGIDPAELARMMERNTRHGSGAFVHTFMTLQDADGDYLASARVRFLWKGGTETVEVPQSGLIHLDIDRAKAVDLKLEAPKRFDRLRQRTIPLGTGYDPNADRLPPGMEPLVSRQDVIDDNDLMERLREGLRVLSGSGKAVPSASLWQQLHRTRTSLDLAPESKAALTPAEIYRQRRDTVVIFGSMSASGQMMMASGVIIAPSGVLVTNYHVLERAREAGTTFGCLTRSERFLPVVEVLAGSRPADLAIVRVEADHLPFAPLAGDVEPGEPVTVISHPSDRFYSLAHGQVSRFFKLTNFGVATVRMTITADYAIGSSGAPMFNARGSVAGIAATTNAVRDQMVFKDGPPVHELRALIEPPKAP